MESATYTLKDYFDGFQQVKRGTHLSAVAQSCYFAILAEFYSAGFPNELRLSVRDLRALAGLKSVSATHEARNVLKNRKLIDFATTGGITVYRLCTEHLTR